MYKLYFYIYIFFRIYIYIKMELVTGDISLPCAQQYIPISFNLKFNDIKITKNSCIANMSWKLPVSDTAKYCWIKPSESTLKRFGPGNVKIMLYPVISTYAGISNSSPRDIYSAECNFYYPGEKAHNILVKAIRIAAGELIKEVTFDVLDDYIMYWTNAEITYRSRPGYQSLAGTRTLYKRDPAKYDKIIAENFVYMGEGLDVFLIKLKKWHCNNMAKAGNLPNPQPCIDICGKDTDLCSYLGLAMCANKNDGRVFSDSCRGLVTANAGVDDDAKQALINKIMENQYGQCEGDFRSDKCYGVSMDQALVNRPTKKKWDQLWSNYCKGDNSTKPECSCYYSGGGTTDVSKYSIPSECLATCSNPVSFGTNAYQPNDVMQKLIVGKDCPSACIAIVNADAGDIAIVDNIKIIQQCAISGGDADNNIGTSIPKWVLKNFPDTCAAYVKYCKVSGHEIQGYISDNLGLVNYSSSDLDEDIKTYTEICGQFKDYDVAQINMMTNNDVQGFEASVSGFMNIDYKKTTDAINDWNSYSNTLKINKFVPDYNTFSSMLVSARTAIKSYTQMRTGYVNALNEASSDMTNKNIFDDEITSLAGMKTGTNTDLKTEYERILSDIQIRGKGGDYVDPGDITPAEPIITPVDDNGGSTNVIPPEPIPKPPIDLGDDSEITFIIIIIIVIIVLLFLLAKFLL